MLLEMAVLLGCAFAFAFGLASLLLQARIDLIDGAFGGEGAPRGAEVVDARGDLHGGEEVGSFLGTISVSELGFFITRFSKAKKKQGEREDRKNLPRC